MADNAIVPISDYAIAQSDPNSIAEILQANVGNSLSEFDLDRIGIPSGGGTSWSVPTLEGEEDRKTIEGVIVYWKDPRAYWIEDFETNPGTPPDCSSDDGVYGEGMFGEGSDANPSGECATCPMNEWASAGGGKRGKACKQMRALFMVTPEIMLPFVVTLPPTSIRPMKQYFLRLASRAVPYSGVITRLELEKVKNSDGIAYSEVRPSVVSVLDGADRDAVAAYGNAIRSSLEKVTITLDANGSVPADA